MGGDEVHPQYFIVEKGERFCIEGTELHSREKVLVMPFFGDRKFVQEIAKILNGNEVSLCQAKDVIRDKILQMLL